MDGQAKLPQPERRYLRRRPVDLAQFVKRSALDDDYTELITDDVLLCDEASGEPLVLYCRLAADALKLRLTLDNIKFNTNERTGGLKTTSRVFGYQPRIALRRDFCTMTSLAVDEPKANSLLCEWGRVIDPYYREFFPRVAAAHEDQVLHVLPEWRIAGTSFTSGIVNRNNPLKYHFDAGNFSQVCSCMIGLKRDVVGGHLCLPEFGLALEIADGSLSIFDGQSLLHGVTPLKRISPNGARYTVVYYALKAMWKCQPLNAELARIKAKRTEREFKRAGLNRAEMSMPKRATVDEYVIDGNGSLIGAAAEDNDESDNPNYGPPATAAHAQAGPEGEPGSGDAHGPASGPVSPDDGSAALPDTREQPTGRH